jgi:hypothetical protein
MLLGSDLSNLALQTGSDYSTCLQTCGASATCAAWVYVDSPGLFHLLCVRNVIIIMKTPSNIVIILSIIPSFPYILSLQPNPM